MPTLTNPMTKPVSIHGLRCLAVACLGIFSILRLVQADTAPVTVTITQRSPIETLSPAGAVTSLSEATVGTRYTLVSCNGPKVILQDARGTQYRIDLSSTDYTPAAPPPSTSPPPVTNVVTQPPSPPSLTNAVAPAAPAIPLTPAPVREPVMSGSKTIQFTGACPSPSRHSRFVRYDFDLNQEHFWLYIPPAYDGHEPWGLMVYLSPAARCEELPDGWGQVLNDDKLLLICPQQVGNGLPYDRRGGLGVVAALEMLKAYSIDPNRVYAAGFSGGARVACNLGFNQSDIFHATIQCCGADFNKAVPRVAVTDTDLHTNPGEYGLLNADANELENAKKNVKFALITGSGDFRQHYIEDIYNGGFKAEGFNATLFNVNGMNHEPCPAPTLREALDFIEKSP